MAQLLKKKIPKKNQFNLFERFKRLIWHFEDYIYLSIYFYLSISIYLYIIEV